MDCPSSTLFSDGFAEEAIGDFMDASNNCICSRNFVLPCINYTGPYMEADEAIELLTLNNLNKIKNTAITFLRDHYKNAVLVYNQMNELLGHVKIPSSDATLEKIKHDITIMINEKNSGDDIPFEFLNTKMEKLQKTDENLKRIREIFVPYDDESIKCKTNPAIRIKLKTKDKDIEEEFKVNEKEQKNMKKVIIQSPIKPEEFKDETDQAIPNSFNITLNYGDQKNEINLLQLDLKEVFNQLLPSTQFADLIHKKPKKKPEGEAKKLIDFVEFTQGKAIFAFEDPSEPQIYFMPYNADFDQGYFPSFDANLATVRELIVADGRISKKDEFFFLDMEKKRIGRGKEKKTTFQSVLIKKGDDYMVNLDKSE